jgi:CRP/FNR family transcriptional regulator, cyclic AMP receptor protein
VLRSHVAGTDLDIMVPALSRVPLFAGLGREELVSLSTVVQTSRYFADEVILVEGQTGDAMYLLRNGAVKVTRSGGQGKEVVLAFLNQGQYFGELSVLDGRERSANVIALEDTEVYVIERSEFLGLIERNSALSIHLLKQLAGQIRAADQQIEYLALGDADSRVLLTLLRIAGEVGEPRDETDVLIERLPQQQDLADMAGTSQETVSKVLKSLETRGLIETAGSGILIRDFPRLQGLTTDSTRTDPVATRP